jgi:hypothetical protein
MDFVDDEPHLDEQPRRSQRHDTPSGSQIAHEDHKADSALARQGIGCKTPPPAESANAAAGLDNASTGDKNPPSG